MLSASSHGMLEVKLSPSIESLFVITCNQSLTEFRSAEQSWQVATGTMTHWIDVAPSLKLTI